ncbi:MAG TPA: TolC family protein [Fimbriimonadales bacterium]|nr:TolC family protein [Fimbriimonadales bacterium]
MNLSFFVIGLSIVPQMIQEVDVLTLDEAVAIAKQKAFNVLSSQMELERIKGVVREAYSMLLPKIDFEATYTRFDKEMTTMFDSSEVVIRPIDRKKLTLTLRQPIDISGMLSLGVSSARALERSSNELITAAVNNAALNAKSAYYDVMKAMELVSVAEENMKNAQARFDLAKKRVDAGVAPRFEVIRAQADLSSAEQGLIRAQNNVSIAKANLNNVLARDINTPFEIERIETAPKIEADMEQLKKTAQENRPELKSLRNQVEYFTAVRRGRERERFPKLNLSVQFEHDPDAQGFGSEKDMLFGTATLGFPIYEGGEIAARVKQARAEEEKARIALREASLAVELEVHQAYLDVQTAYKVVETARRNVDEAKEALRLATIRYEAGVSIQVEVSDASVQYIDALTSYVNAIADYRMALARLQRAIGTEKIPIKE